jgi:hypothetical protein
MTKALAFCSRLFLPLPPAGQEDTGIHEHLIDGQKQSSRNMNWLID